MKKEIKKLFAGMTTFLIIERVKGKLCYIVEARNSHYYPLKDSVSYTSTFAGAKKRLTAYCKRNKVKNYITIEERIR